MHWCTETYKSMAGDPTSEPWICRFLCTSASSIRGLSGGVSLRCGLRGMLVGDPQPRQEHPPTCLSTHIEETLHLKDLELMMHWCTDSMWVERHVGGCSCRGWGFDCEGEDSVMAVGDDGEVKDLELMMHWCTETYKSMAGDPTSERIWQTTIPQL
jgi:hypothetical protein